MIDFVSLPSSCPDTLPLPPVVPTDARQLLSDFASTGRQEPFEEIVRRYGAMVFNLCFEVTGNRHDAEDAVQAAFLSLAVQAKSGQPVQAIGPWLQQVARRMSLDLNRSRKRRKNREQRHGQNWENRMSDARADASGGAGAHGNPASAAGWEELRQVVQQELGELPPKYRMPLILHYYGGLSREEMARELNCRANTLGVRLHRGREMLSKRLARRGVTLSGVILGVLMTEVVRSIVTDRLVHSTAHAAALISAGHPYACGVVAPQIVALAQTATRALANAKIKLAATLAFLAGGAAAAGAQAVHSGAWNLSHPSNWDVGRVFRWLFNPPAFNPAPRVQSPTAPIIPSDLAFNQSTNNIASPVVHSQSPSITSIPHHNWRYGIDWRSWNVPLPPRPGDSIEPPRNLHTPPLAIRIDGNPNLPPPVNNDRAINAPIVFSGPAGGGGRLRSTDNPAAEDIAGNDRRKDEDPQDSKGRGGVKPRRSGIAEDGSPKPKAFTPDGVANQFIPNPAPQPHPHLNPNAPPPFRPNPDAQKVTQPPSDPGGQTPNGGARSGDLLNISTDYNPDNPASFDALLTTGIGPANFQIGPGDVAGNQQVIVGNLGTGVATQTGGVHTIDSLYLGVIKTGRGMYQLTGGELQVTASPSGPDAPVHSIEIGSAGEGLFLLGNADSTGQITQPGETGGPVNLTVGAIRSARGTLQGWGSVALTGQLTNNGRVIADGYGQQRTLDLSTFASVSNDFCNRDTKGWFAVNRGRLDLPAIAVAPGTHTYTWGGSNDDKLSLVNSARLTFNDVQNDAVVRIALLALDRDDIPALPDGHHFIGIWSFDPSDLSATGGLDLLVRYDDALAAEKNLDENVLKLWKFDGQWQRLDFDPTFVRDPINHTLFVHTGIEGMTHFAVSAPEPATLSMIVLGSALALSKRRRRAPKAG